MIVTSQLLWLAVLVPWVEVVDRLDDDMAVGATVAKRRNARSSDETVLRPGLRVGMDTNVPFLLFDLKWRMLG